MSILCTRDCARFRKQRSPVAALSDGFFDLLGGDGPESVAMRNCFAHCLTGSAENKPGAHDAELRRLFAAPPAVALIQGPLRPDFLFETTAAPGTPNSPASLRSDAKSVNSISTGGTDAPELADLILLPFVFHQQLLEAAEHVGDPDSHLPPVSTLKQVCLNAIAHETAHWLWHKRGYVPDPRRRRIAGGVKTAVCSTQRPDDDLILIALEPSDAGLLAITGLFGYFFKHITTANGITEVVKRRPDNVPIPPTPAITAGSLNKLLGGSLPKMRDLSGWPHALTGEAPKWIEDPTYLIVGQLGPNASCHHGNCRLGDGASS